MKMGRADERSRLLRVIIDYRLQFQINKVVSVDSARPLPILDCRMIR